MVAKPVLRLVGTRFGTWFGVWFLRYSKDWEDDELNERELSSELLGVGLWCMGMGVGGFGGRWGWVAFGG
jgi:hypothetical protein